jgi:hypothetical protein
MRTLRALSLPALAALALAASAAPAAQAESPPPGVQAFGRWALTAVDPTPLQFFQGLTHTTAGDFLFVGVFQGGYRTGPDLQTLASNGALIPPAVQADPGFNHIGDPTFDRAEGGRLLAPMECYFPGTPNGGNTCRQGGIGVVDPTTLAWRYWVRLDPADIPKAMWAEVSPDGKLLWTSSGKDLLAYATADISLAHAATSSASTPIRPVRRLVGAVPPSGVTGAAFVGRRLLLAGELNGYLQVRSVDLQTGAQRPEITLLGVSAESEGLDLLDARGGELHWLLSPFGDNGPPTFGSTHTELLSFVRRADSRLLVDVSPAQVATRAPATVTATVQLDFAGKLHPVEGATVTVKGAQAVTDAAGHAVLTLPPVLRTRTLAVTASKAGLRTGHATLRAVG